MEPIDLCSDDELDKGVIDELGSSFGSEETVVSVEYVKEVRKRKLKELESDEESVDSESTDGE